MEVQKFERIRHFLTSALNERKQINQSYSLRAFARDLGVSHSKLSKVLNGKQGLSEELALGMAEALGFSHEKKDFFLTVVQAENRRSRRKRLFALEKLREEESALNFSYLKDLDFQEIKNWYHYAILELVKVAGFKSDLGWIAKRLGISKTESTEAVNRLLRFRFLEKEDGQIQSAGSRLNIDAKESQESVKEYNKQVIGKALKAIDEQPKSSRRISTQTIAIHQKDLPRLMERVSQMQEEFADFATSLNEDREPLKPDTVYNLNMQFFSLLENFEESK